MPPEKWTQLENFFNQAIDMSPDAQKAFLEKIAAQHPGMEKDLESLLQAHEKAKDFLETPGIERLHPGRLDESENEFLGKTVGAYKIERCIGKGGMGVVFQANRTDGVFEKRAAIKFVKDHFGRELLIKRFQNERQALASLSHPNIAKIMDAGTFQGKHPYFIMEFIDGIPIDQYCFSKKLGVIDILELFLKVCSAVQYAHQNLIIHRDLKPSNLLVTKTGEPVLLDFGIAKILDQEILPHDNTLTHAHQKVFTPDFASPEQIKGDNITTASDIYSLGVNLFKILTGALPYKTEQKSTFEVQKIIVEDEPRRPSTALRERLTAQSGQTFKQSFQKNLPKFLSGDLDNIVLKALRKEPSRRYLSVEQFAADIRNFLNGLPVAASKSTFKYRTSKFLKRHKTAAVLTTVIFLSLIAGVIATMRQARIAEQERNKAVLRYEEVRQLSNALIFDVHDVIKDLPGATAARKLVMTNATAYLDKLSREESDPELLLELAQGYERIGDVLGNPTNANLGDLSGATESYLKAQKLIETVAQNNGHSDKVPGLLASINENLGDVYTGAGKMDIAIECFEAALAYYKANFRNDSLNIDKQKKLAIGHIKYGDVLGNKHFRNIGKVDEALVQYSKSLVIWESLINERPDEQEVIRLLGLTHERSGTIHLQKENLREAEKHFTLSLELRKEVVHRFPRNYDTQRDLAIGFENMAAIHKLEGNLQKATDNQKEALKIHEDLIASDPENVQALTTVTVVLERLSESNRLQGNHEAARLYTKRFLEIHKKLAERPNATANELNLYAYYLATCLPKDLRNPEQALIYAKKAEQATNGKDPSILDTVAMAYFVNGKIDEAIAVQTKALSLLDEHSTIRGEIEKNLNTFLAAKQKKAGN